MGLEFLTELSAELQPQVTSLLRGRTLWLIEQGPAFDPDDLHALPWTRRIRIAEGQTPEPKLPREERANLAVVRTRSLNRTTVDYVRTLLDLDTRSLLVARRWKSDLLRETIDYGVEYFVQEKMLPLAGACMAMVAAWDRGLGSIPKLLGLAERPLQSAAVAAEVALRYAMSPRECEAIYFAIEGKTVAESANRLGISESSIRRARRYACKKVGADNCVDLLRVLAGSGGT